MALFQKYQDNIVYSYGCKLICVDDRYCKPYKTSFGEDVAGKHLSVVIKENEYCSKVIKTNLNKPFAMTKRDREDFDNSAKCWIGKKHMKKVK